MIDIQMDDTAVRELISAFPKEAKAAVKSSVRRALSAASTELKQGIAAEAFMKKSLISSAVSKPVLTAQGDEVTGTVTVRSRAAPADTFRLHPRAVTARKGAPMRARPSPGYQVGKTQPVRHVPRSGEKSAAFIARIGGRLQMMHRRSGSRGDLERVRGVPVQYFAAFEENGRRFMEVASGKFRERFFHEMSHRLGKK